MATTYDEMGNVIFSDDAGAYATSPNITEVNYYKQKLTEFQSMLNELDATAQSAANIIELTPESQLADDMRVYLDQWDNKRSQFKIAAEGINLAIAGANSLGIDLQKLSLPTGLGFAPAAPVALSAVAAAVAAAAILIIWGRDWIAGVNERAKLALQYENLSPEIRDSVVQEQIRIDQAQAKANESPLSTIAGSIKWIAIAAVAFFAYRAFSKG
mgnify:CR=1 FL=1